MKKEVDTFITKSKHFESVCCKHTFLINEKEQFETTWWDLI